MSRHCSALAFALALLACSARSRDAEGPHADAPAAHPLATASVDSTPPGPTTTWCPGLRGLSAMPGDASPSWTVDEARRVLASRERDLLACPGVESAWLARLPDGTIALMLWVQPAETEPHVSPRRSLEPSLWLDGAPLLIWEPGACLLDVRTFVRSVPFSNGSNELGADGERALEQAAAYLHEHPEYSAVAVSGLGGGGARSQRARRVAHWLNARGLRTMPERTTEASTAIVLSAEPERSCGSRHVYFR